MGFRAPHQNSDPGRVYGTVDISSTDYAPAGGFRAIHVGGAGAVVIQDFNDANHTFSGLIAGGQYSYGGKKIIRTNTTATLLVVVLDSPK